MEVARVWDLCRDIYSTHGKALKLPANTDPKKTYQWRYLSKLTETLEAMDLDDRLSRRYVELAVQYAAAHRLLAKGLAIFCQSNLQDVFFDRFQADMRNNRDAHGGLLRSATWVDSHGGPGEFLRRQNTLGYCNLVKWYQAGRVTELYLSLSRTAGRAMRRMSEDDRLALPTITRLYLVRNQFLTSLDNLERSREIMGGDLLDGIANSRTPVGIGSK